MADVEIIINDVEIYDQIEEYENCHVQILSNSKTGEVSVGWWPETQEEIRIG